MSKHIDYEINKELGECYLFMGEFEKAVSYYEKAAECSTDKADPYLGMAAIAMQLGKFEEAEKRYLSAIAVEPIDKSYAGLALAEVELKKHDSAFEHIEKALQINPTNLVGLNTLVQLGYATSRLEDVLPKLRGSLAVQDNEVVRFALAGCLSSLGQTENARKELEVLLGKNPENERAQELYARLAA